MLSFRWVLGDMTDNSPGEIPALLADLANADEEHVDVGFEKGDYGVGILVDRWIYISDLEEDSLSPCSFRAPDDETIVEIGRLLDAGRTRSWSATRGRTATPGPTAEAARPDR